MQLSDELVTKDVPSYLGRLVRRAGARPRIAKAFPCLQETEGAVLPPPAVVELAGELPGVSVLAPKQTIPEASALVLDQELALGQAEAFIIGREFAHVRRDTSIHLTLAPEWADHVIAKGWAQPHPLALYGLIAPQNVVVYAPRDESDLHAARRLLVASYSFATGRVVELAT